MVEVHRAIAEAARLWQDPDYPARKRAVRQTLAESNRFTEGALAFAVNQQMSLLTEDSLAAWLGTEAVANPIHVGVIEAGNVPFAGLQDYLAVVGVGHRFLGAVSRRSPWLLPAFADEVAEQGGPGSHFVDNDAVVDVSDALIASGTDETIATLESACEEADIPSLLRGNRYSVAVLDGGETEEDRLGLAEDALLHEGLGCRNVALVFAPKDLDADPYFEALSVFRGTLQAHPDTSGSLKMQQAFLAAVKAPHAYGEGLVYLVSRGEAEVQSPAHIRWVPYSELAEVSEWLAGHADEMQLIAARVAVREQLAIPVEMVDLGEAQRPPLDWKPDGVDTVAFLRGL
ncbi:MAG: hypothetical protein HKN29_13200 [Rhodothermales bacterium]|nr:hypothetical protein [Rhodothermales bacterium]